MDNFKELTDTKPDVVFVPKFLPQAEADELLARIKTAVDFRQNHIELFGRKAIPRDVSAECGPPRDVGVS
jgi:hypothetical protein